MTGEAIANNAAGGTAVLNAADSNSGVKSDSNDSPLEREKLYEKTVWGMRVLAIGFPLFAIPLMLSTYYQSIGHAKAALIVSFLREVFVLVPLIIFMPMVFNLFYDAEEGLSAIDGVWYQPVNGVWYAQPVADVLCAIICGYLLLRERGKVHRKMLECKREHIPLAEAGTGVAKA